MKYFNEGKYKLPIFLYVGLFLLINLAKAQSIPNIPNSDFNIADYGAIGDGKTLNTESIQRAIDKAGEHGGKVIIPKGKFLCGPLELHSKINIEIAKEAVLILSNEIVSYPANKKNYLN